MYSCASLAGVPVNDLFMSIQGIAYTMKNYNTLMKMVHNVLEKNMLLQMQKEDMYILSALTSLYTVLTGHKPLVSVTGNKIFSSYREGIEAVLLADLETAQLLRSLYFAAEVGRISGLFAFFFTLKNIQATNMNYLLLINKLNKPG